MKLNTTTLLFLCSLLNTVSVAQDYFYNNQYYETDFLFEGGLSLGGINCFTDIGGRPGNGKAFLKDFNGQNTRFCGGVFVNLSYRYAISARLELSRGTIMAYDSILKNDPSEGQYRYRRNLHFKSSVTELLLLTELHPTVLFYDGQRRSFFSPYLVGGVGVFWFNPLAYLNGEWIELHRMHTEGQGFAEYPDRKPYRLTQMNFPVGAGIKFECSARMNFRFEVLHRITRTDYLDDVSTRYIDPALFEKYLSPLYASYALQLHDRQQEIDPLSKTVPNAIRGNSSRNDSYFTVQMKLSFVINRERR